MDELKISVTAGPAHTLVTVAGECDLNTGRQLRDVLTSEVSRGVRRLILDLSGLTFMDSTGMQVLLSIRTVLTVRGGTLALVSPQPVVARILELTGADQVIPIFDSLRDAQTADWARLPGCRLTAGFGRAPRRPDRRLSALLRRRCRHPISCVQPTPPHTQAGLLASIAAAAVATRGR